MKILKPWAALLLVGMVATTGATQKPPEVDVRIVKYDGLKEAVLKNRGKVILIDFWGYF